MINLMLKRLYRKETYSIGNLFIDGKYFCDTCEDRCRDLYDFMSEQEIKAKKVYGETAIPYGTYKVIISYSPKFKKNLPLLCKVKGFEGIRIHSGNFAKDSLGCILVGKNTVKGGVTESRKTMDALMKILTKDNKEEIFITIEP